MFPVQKTVDIHNPHGVIINVKLVHDEVCVCVCVFL